MVKKVITNLDLSKVPGPDFIPVVVLQNCELNFHMYYGGTFQCASEIALFSRLLEGFISGPSI